MVHKTGSQDLVLTPFIKEEGVIKNQRERYSGKGNFPHGKSSVAIGASIKW